MLDLFPSRDAGRFGAGSNARARAHAGHHCHRLPRRRQDHAGARFLATPKARARGRHHEFGSVASTMRYARVTDDVTLLGNVAYAATPAPTCKTHCAISSPSARKARCRSLSEY